LEESNNQLQQTLSLMEKRKEESRKAQQNLHLILAAQNIARRTLSPRGRTTAAED
jgi:uncharacterized membrane protein YccC